MFKFFSRFWYVENSTWYYENTANFLYSYENLRNRFDKGFSNKEEFKEWFFRWLPFLKKIQNRWFDNEINFLLEKGIVQKSEIAELYTTL